MASTGTRPPLFDPDPGGFDDDVAEPRFPRRPSSGGRGKDGSSPRWVRPFILGGLVLVALISLLSVLTGGEETPDRTPTVVTTSSEVAAADQATAPPARTASTGTDAVVDTPPTSQPSAAAPVEAADATAVPAEPTPVLPASPTLQRATAFAVQFAHDYLNYDQANPEVRQRELRLYLAPGVDPQLGWNGQGSQVAVLTVPVESRETEDGAAVTVAAQVTGRDAPRWVHLAVEVVRDDQGRLAIRRAPAFVPRPQPGVPAEAPARALDQVLSDQLQSGMQPLFAAFASDPAVDVPGTTAPGATIRGLGGQVSLGSVGPLRVFVGDDTTREAQIDVAWLDEVTGGTTSQTYILRLSAVDGSWLVTAITTG